MPVNGDRQVRSQMEAVRFKRVDEADLPVVLDIYNHYILTTTATFRLQPITMETLRTFIFVNHHRYGACLIYNRGEIAGFCFLTQYKGVEAYDRTAEMGVYLKPAFTRRGLGAEAVRHLEQAAAANGVKVVIASISGENEASIKLFRKLGYEECGHFKRVGEKWGRVIDVVWFQRGLEVDERGAIGC
jgi:L-amino acid N-acyltransferase YncA